VYTRAASKLHEDWIDAEESQARTGSGQPWPDRSRRTVFSEAIVHLVTVPAF